MEMFLIIILFFMNLMLYFMYKECVNKINEIIVYINKNIK